MSELAYGWAAVCGAVICFGSFGVPIKKITNVDPVIFQSYKSFWVFITCFVALTYNQFYYSPYGLLSGLSWVPAGIAAVLAVNCIGLGIAQGIWNGIIVVVSFCWGAFVFNEPLKSLLYSVLGIGTLVIGITGMALSRLEFWFDLRKICCKKSYYTLLDDNQTSVYSEDAAIKEQTTTPTEWSVNICCCTVSQRAVGYSAALFNGLWGGSIMVPFKLAQQSNAGIEFVFSFGVGAMVVNILILIIYSIVLRFVFSRPTPSFQFRKMAGPGSISGILWSMGNYLSIYAVIYLGQSIGYTAVQASLLVSGLWGIFYYKELKGLQIVVWFISALFALGGIAILSQMKA